MGTHRAMGESDGSNTPCKGMTFLCAAAAVRESTSLENAARSAGVAVGTSLTATGAPPKVPLKTVPNEPTPIRRSRNTRKTLEMVTSTSAWSAKRCASRSDVIARPPPCSVQVH